MKKKDWLKLAASIAICEGAGIIGSFYTAPAIRDGWYGALPKPYLNPPSWIFAPVWTALFLLMGIAAFLVWNKNWNLKEKKLALGVFALQLILNSAWSAIFFGLKSPIAAFFELVLLWLAIAATIWIFAKISRPAAWLLVPYMLWVSFAGYLNLSLSGILPDAADNQPIGCTLEAKQCPDGTYVGRSGPACEFAPCK